MSMKNSNDTIGNRNPNLPACSAVPQLTAPPRVPDTGGVLQNSKLYGMWEEASVPFLMGNVPSD